MASVIDENTIHARIMFVKTFKLTVVGIPILIKKWDESSSGYHAYFVCSFSERIVCAEKEQ